MAGLEDESRQLEHQQVYGEAFRGLFELQAELGEAELDRRLEALDRKAEEIARSMGWDARPVRSGLSAPEGEHPAYDRLVRYSIGRFAGEEDAGISGHLQECAECRRHAQIVQEVRARYGKGEPSTGSLQSADRQKLEGEQFAQGMAIALIAGAVWTEARIRLLLAALALWRQQHTPMVRGGLQEAMSQDVQVALGNESFEPTGEEFSCRVLEGPEITPAGEFRLALRTKDPRVNAATLRCELLLGEDEAVRAFGQFDADENGASETRLHVFGVPVGALGPLGGPRLLPLDRLVEVKRQLLEGNASEREEAIRALGATGDRNVIEILDEMTLDEDEGVRTAAWEAIQKVQDVQPLEEPVTVPWEAINIVVCPETAG